MTLILTVKLRKNNSFKISKIFRFKSPKDKFLPTVLKNLQEASKESVLFLQNHKIKKRKKNWKVKMQVSKLVKMIQCGQNFMKKLGKKKNN